MSPRKIDPKHPDKLRITSAQRKVRVVWDRKPHTKVKDSAKVYDRKRDNFLDEKYRGL